MIRSFVAAGLSEELRNQLEACLQPLRKAYPGIAWARPENLHFTLAFLGSLEESRIPEVIQACIRAAAMHAPFQLSLAGFGTFPPRGRPRVFWLGAQAGANELTVLQQDVARGLLALNLALEERPFVPHLTLGRVKDPASRLPEKSVWDASLPAMRVDGIEVMRSDLKPSGAVYSVLARCPLA